MIRRLLLPLSGLWLLALPVFAQPAPQNEFVPIDKLPPADQLPSAPLLVGAYAFVWLAAMFYMWTIWRRLGKVEADLHALEQRGRGKGAPGVSDRREGAPE
jgi:hypothetical protein